MELLEKQTDIVNACVRMRQLPQEARSGLAATLLATMRRVAMDEPTRTAADDAVFFCVCQQERHGAIDRLSALKAIPNFRAG